MRTVLGPICVWLACFGGTQLAVAQENDEKKDEEAATPPKAEEPTAEPPREGDAKTPVENVKPGQNRGWSDIYVVPRRPVLKRRRIELMPTYNITMNNPVIIHHGFGAQLAIYLSEAFFIGVEGTYYQKQLTSRYFLLGLDQRVLPSVNEYLWSAFLDVGYVPIQGKLTLPFSRAVMHFEVWVALGVGVFHTRVVARNPGDSRFENIPVISVMLPAIGTRLWLSRWLSIDAYVKNYLFVDNLEPTSRLDGETPDMAKGRAISTFTVDTVFGVGLSVFLPPGFEYKTLR